MPSINGAIVLVTATVGVAMTGNPAYAQYILLNANSGKVLDLPTQCEGNNGCQLQQWDWVGGSNQQWQVTPLGDGYNQITNVNSGKALDLPTQCQGNDGCQLQQWDWVGGANQQWQVISLGNGYNEIVNMSSGRVIDLAAPCEGNDGCLVQQWDWLNGDNQQWALVAVTSMPGPLPSLPPPNEGTGWTCDTGGSGSGPCPESALCQDYSPGVFPADYCTYPSGGCPDGYYSSNYCCYNATPIVVDAFGEGFHLTGLTAGVHFRVLPDQSLYQVSWTDPHWRNAWLALDRNGNGMIDDFTELFGNFTPQPKSAAPNGYSALAVFDDPANGGNGNGVIDPGDSVYDHLRLWIDANHNGLSEASVPLHQVEDIVGDVEVSSTPILSSMAHMIYPVRRKTR